MYFNEENIPNIFLFNQPISRIFPISFHEYTVNPFIRLDLSLYSKTFGFGFSMHCY